MLWIIFSFLFFIFLCYLFFTVGSENLTNRSVDNHSGISLYSWSTCLLLGLYSLRMAVWSVGLDAFLSFLLDILRRDLYEQVVIWDYLYFERENVLAFPNIKDRLVQLRIFELEFSEEFTTFLPLSLPINSGICLLIEPDLYRLSVFFSSVFGYLLVI